MFQERILYTSCPICQSDDLAFDKTADCSQHAAYRPPLSPAINWMRCEACGHRFSEGHFSEEALEILQETKIPNMAAGDNMEANRAIASQTIERVIEFVREGRWLDVGVGNGAFLFTAEEFGFKVTGLDRRPDSAVLLGELGFDIRREEIETFESDLPFDVISMSNVLAQMPQPRTALTAAHRLLRPGGVLFLSLPNADALLWKAMERQSLNPYWGELEHYHHFGRKALYDLLEDCGFRPERYCASQRFRCSMEVIASRQP